MHSKKYIRLPNGAVYTSVTVAQTKLILKYIFWYSSLQEKVHRVEMLLRRLLVVSDAFLLDQIPSSEMRGTKTNILLAYAISTVFTKPPAVEVLISCHPNFHRSKLLNKAQ